MICETQKATDSLLLFVARVDGMGEKHVFLKTKIGYSGWHLRAFRGGGWVMERLEFPHLVRQPMAGICLCRTTDGCEIPSLLMNWGEAWNCGK